MIRRILLANVIGGLWVAVIGLQWSSVPEEAPPASRNPAAEAPADSSTAPATQAEADPDAIYVRWGGKLIRTEDTTPDRDGQFHRTQWVQTRLKYPLLRVEEQLRRRSPQDRAEVLSRTIVAADHILIKLKPGQDDEAIQNLITQIQTEIPVELKEVRPFSGKLLVAFDGSRPKALETALQAFRKRSDQVASAQVDAVVQLGN